MPQLFTPLALGPMTIPNRIAISPMCQHSANDGSASDWHLQHLMQFALSGAGLAVVEATAVERSGRISHGCLGLYSDANEAALARVLTAARSVAANGTRFAIQLCHSGRKGSTQRPWEGNGPLSAGDDAWTTVAPSAIPLADGWPTPKALETAEIERVIAAFAKAAGRAVRIGFDAVEMHFAHGYLVHEFFSPVSNRRSDAYGGARDGRMRLAWAIAEAVRAVVPRDVALGARISGSDWLDDGAGPDDAVALARALKAAGLDYVCVSSGGLTLTAKIKIGPGYQAPFAAKVKTEAGLPTRTVGLITRPEQAEELVATGQVDMIALARAFLDNPRWVWHAADWLGRHDRLPAAV